VLTEPARFGGSLDDLRAVAGAVTVPVLRKDFIVDPYQIWEAAGGGAAGVLLIVAALNDDELRALLDECAACGVDALVEVHEEAELGRALAAGAQLVGINNRDLRTLTVDLGVTGRLAAVPHDGVLLVSESGIATGAGARRVAAAGARALLVGEALVCAPPRRLEALVRELKGAAPAMEEGQVERTMDEGQVERKAES
jgi:indole-3-glycerol phosphate synthase